MIVPKTGYIQKTVPMLCFIVIAGWLVWWTGHNPLPDGYQNEFLHVGNTFDLYEAVVSLDWWHIRWYALYIVLAVGILCCANGVVDSFWKRYSSIGTEQSTLFGSSHVEYAAIGRKSVKVQCRMYLLLLTPAVFGGMTRFEPNFCQRCYDFIGTIVFDGVNYFRHRKWSLAWGLVFGSALMLDRLTVLFLSGTCLPLCVDESAVERTTVRRSILYSMLLFFGCTTAYYREFFIRHSNELLSQAPVGEIDSTGTLLTSINPIPSFYYVLSLFDSQAGWGVGLLMIGGVFYAVKRREEQDMLLLSATLPGVLFFTFIAKKQVYYTFPMLVPLALLAGRFQKLSWLGVNLWCNIVGTTRCGVDFF